MPGVAGNRSKSVGAVSSQKGNQNLQSSTVTEGYRQAIRSNAPKEDREIQCDEDDEPEVVLVDESGTQTDEGMEVITPEPSLSL
jgi:stage III sporulation protein SpoIIIAA